MVLQQLFFVVVAAAMEVFGESSQGEKNDFVVGSAASPPPPVVVPEDAEFYGLNNTCLYVSSVGMRGPSGVLHAKRGAELTVLKWMMTTPTYSDLLHSGNTDKPVAVVVTAQGNSPFSVGTGAGFFYKCGVSGPAEWVRENWSRVNESKKFVILTEVGEVAVLGEICEIVKYTNDKGLFTVKSELGVMFTVTLQAGFPLPPEAYYCGGENFTVGGSVYFRSMVVDGQTEQIISQSVGVGRVLQIPGDENGAVAKVALNGVVFDVWNKTSLCFGYEDTSHHYGYDPVVVYPRVGREWFKKFDSTTAPRAVTRYTPTEGVVELEGVENTTVSSGFFTEKPEVRVEVGLLFRFNDVFRTKTGETVVGPGSTGVVISTQPKVVVLVKGKTIPVDTTMGDYLPNPGRLVDEISPTGRVLTTNIMILLFSGGLYTLGILGRYLSIDFNLVSGCGMPVSHLSKPLMVWYYLCVALSLIWNGLDFAVRVTSKGVAAAYAAAKRWHESRGVR